MNRSIVLGGVAAALALALASAPTTASASCSDRKTTGTIVGGIGGALLGNSISGGGGGAILGGLGGAVAGHAIAGAGCGRYYRHSYNDRGYYGHGRSYGYRNSGYRGYDQRGPAYAPATHTTYWDARGNAISRDEPVGYGRTSYASSNCGVDQSYYDSRGNLVQRPAAPCR
jgi:hypothetical protein